MLALWSAGAVGQARGGPEMFEGTRHDFGAVPRGSIVVHQFRWRNATTKCLEVCEIQSSCSCVRAQAFPRVLEPGESGSIEVEMDTRQFVGTKSVEVQVRMEPGPRLVTLQVCAQSRPEVSVSPGNIRFAAQQPVGILERSLDIEYLGVLDWQIVEIRNPYPFLSARLEPLYRRSGEVGYRLRVRLKENAPVGDWLAVLTLRTNDPAWPVFPVQVEGHLRPAITATPGRLHLTSASHCPTQQHIVLRADEPFRIVEVCEVPAGLVVEVGSERSQNLHVVTVRRTTQGSFSSGGVIRLATDCPQQPQVTIPVVVNLER